MQELESLRRHPRYAVVNALDNIEELQDAVGIAARIRFESATRDSTPSAMAKSRAVDRLKAPTLRHIARRPLEGVCSAQIRGLGDFACETRTSIL